MDCRILVGRYFQSVIANDGLRMPRLQTVLNNFDGKRMIGLAPPSSSFFSLREEMNCTQAAGSDAGTMLALRPIQHCIFSVNDERVLGTGRFMHCVFSVFSGSLIEGSVFQ